MNQQQLATKLALDALGIPIELATFDERLIVQKAMYLTNVAGFDRGHYFRWYLRGPYSPELTRDVFGIKAEIEAGLDDSGGWVLGRDAVQQLARVKKLIPDGDRAARARKLELLASVHFLVDRKQVSGPDARALMTLLAKYDKDYSESEVAEALRELRDHALLSQ
jgi:hypothetical protein